MMALSLFILLLWCLSLQDLHADKNGQIQHAEHELMEVE